MLFSYALRSLWARRRTSATAVIGLVLVAVVLSGSLMLSAGTAAVFERAGRQDVALFAKRDAVGEPLSAVSRTELATVVNAAERRGITAAQISAEAVSGIILPRKDGGGVTNVTFRGVEPAAFPLRRSFTIVEGRRPQPGTDEAIVGVAIRGRFDGLELGGKVPVSRAYAPTIVGVFADDGSAYESEVWCDRGLLSGALLIGSGTSTIRVPLRSPTDIDAYRAAIEGDKRIRLTVTTEREFFLEQSTSMVALIGALGGILSILMSIAAIVGAIITLLASVASRSREIGTMRALGFSRRAILASVLTEAIVISVVGGSIGLALSLALTRVKVTLMSTSGAEVGFRFQANVGTLLLALFLVLGVGVAGGLVPAVRAARIRAIEALRAA